MVQEKRCICFASAGTPWLAATSSENAAIDFINMMLPPPVGCLPIAVKMIVTVVKSAAALPMGNAQHAIDGSDCAANTCPNRLADNAADGASYPVSFVRTFLRASHDTLRVSDLRKGQQGKSERCGGKIKLRHRADRAGRHLRFVHNHLIS